MKDASPAGSLVLWVAWILTAILAGAPCSELVFFPICRALGVVHLPRIFEMPLGIYLFLLYGLAKPVCLVVAVCFAVLAAKSDIPQRKKLITLSMMLLACGYVLYRASIVKHEW